MKQHGQTRRRALRQIGGLGILGGLAGMRPLAALAAAVRDNVYTTRIPGVQGKIIKQGDGNYELWRRAMVWHHSKPRRFPELIVQAQSRDDVVAALGHAAANNLRVAIRAGGHNSTGTSVRQGGMVIDLSALRSIEIKASDRLASIQPGVRSLDLTQAAGRHGLCFPGPHCPSVGISGFSLGGGIGWNYAQLGGMATHSIVGAEVVTADGRVLEVSANHHPDLFWALRGAGPGFFGVVTRLDLQLYPLARSIMASSYIHPLSELQSVTGALDNIREQHDLSRVELLLVLMHNPMAPADAPPEQSKICFTMAYAFEDSPEQARAALAPLAASALPRNCLDKSEQQEFLLPEMYDRYFSIRDPAGRQARYKVDNILTNRGSDTLLALAEHFRTGAPGPSCHVLASYNMATQQKDDSCFSWAADCYVGCYAIWDDEREDDRNYRWLGDCLPLMDPFAVGHYPNEIEPRHEDRYRKCYSAENWRRLGQLKAKYDPDGVFHTYLTRDEVLRENQVPGAT